MYLASARIGEALSILAFTLFGTAIYIYEIYDKGHYHI